MELWRRVIFDKGREDTKAGDAQAGRGGALVVTRILARVPAWQHILKAVLYSMDDLMQRVRVKKGSSEAGPSRLPIYLRFNQHRTYISLPGHLALLTIRDTSD